MSGPARPYSTVDGGALTMATSVASPTSGVIMFDDPLFTGTKGILVSNLFTQFAAALSTSYLPLTGGTMTGSITGNLIGNVTGNVSGSSGSCTGNAATATLATLASTVTTNANLTGPITSVGNATSIASQTGTGTTFAMSASPTFTGTVTGSVLSFNGASQFLNTLLVTGFATFSTLTASLPVFTDGGKGLISNAMTGTGSVVMSASPTLTGTITAAAATLSGILTLNSAVTTGQTTSAGLVFTGNSLTTGDGIYAASSTLTTGNLMSLAVTGTAAGASQTVLNISTSGAVTGAVTTYGGQISNTHTGASATNVGLKLVASGATTANLALQLTGSIAPVSDGTTGINFANAAGTSIAAVDTTNSGITIGSAAALTFRTANSGSNIIAQLAAGVTQNQIGLVSGSGFANFSMQTWNGTRWIEVCAVSTGSISGTSGSEKADMLFLTKPTGSLGLERMRIMSTGQVGIGTSNAATALSLANAGVLSWEASAGVAQTGVNGSAAGVIGITNGGATTYATVGNGGITLANSTNVALTFTALGAASSAAGGVLSVVLQSAGTLSGNNAAGTGVFKAGAPNGSGAVSNWQFQNSGGTAYCTLQDTILADDTTSFFKFVGTIPTTPTADILGPVLFSITSAGSAAFAQYASRFLLNAGYTGIKTTVALGAANSVAGTNVASIGNVRGNLGFYARSDATTTGTNVGGIGYAIGGNQSIGLAGVAITTKNSATNIGVLGFGLNGGTSPIQIGGYFGLHGTTDPTFASCAICADNGSTTSPIALFRDNGTTVLTVDDNGPVTFAPVATTGTPGAAIKLTTPAHTALTTAVAYNTILTTAATQQWAAGTVASQSYMLLNAPTLSGASATAAFTQAATLTLSGAPVKGTNATISKTHGLLILAGAVSTASNSYGLTCNAQTGGTSNYSAVFLGGRVGFGTSSPSATLDVIDATEQLRIGSDATNFCSFTMTTFLTIAPQSSGSQSQILLTASEVDFSDGVNIGLGTTNGTKIGVATSQKLGLWNATPVIQPSGAGQTAITDSTGGSTADFTIVDVGVVFSQTAINNNFAKITRLMNQLRGDLVLSGNIKGSA